MLYRKIIAVCSEIYKKHIKTLCGQNVEFLNVKPGGTYSDHWAFLPKILAQLLALVLALVVMVVVLLVTAEERNPTFTFEWLFLFWTLSVVYYII